MAHIGQELRLVLARLREFIEQADVLDGDYGLIGKGRYQRDLIIGERFRLLSIDDDTAHQFALFQHRNG